jgi:hypothetical protein
MRAVSLFLALVLMSPQAAADSPTSSPISKPAILSLPAGNRLVLPQGTFHGYSLDEMKIVLKIEASYRALAGQVIEYDKLVKNITELSNNRAKQIELLKNQVEIVKKDRDRITAKWTEDNRLRHECENKPAFGSWVSWGVAAAATAVAVVLTGVLLARD